MLPRSKGRRGLSWERSDVSQSPWELTVSALGSTPTSGREGGDNLSTYCAPGPVVDAEAVTDLDRQRGVGSEGQLQGRIPSNNGATLPILGMSR